MKEYAMSYTTDHKQKFTDLTYHIRNQDQLRKQANGGNSILFSYPPEEESLYIEKARELCSENAIFIDISKIFVQFIDKDGWDSFKDYYDDYKDTPYLIFKSEDPGEDLFDLIINEIEKASKNDRIPILIRTGCLYGTGIENANIMEHRTIMSMSHPLVIFYPSKIEEDKILFLNFKPASKYRCVLVK
jgi:hypothetical protein